MGALSIFALLGILALQVGSGLMSDDEIAAAGPLVKWVSSVWVGNATFYHKEIGKLLLLALIALHVSAIGFYFFKKHENLIQAMVKGDKRLDFQAESTVDTGASRRKALVIAIFCIAAVASLISWIG
jgi:cytochrome b